MKDLGLGLACVALGLALALWWIPDQTGTGLVERVRGRSQIGDAMLPTLAAGLLALGGALLGLRGALTGGGTLPSRGNLAFQALLLAILAGALLTMRWTGPLLAGLFDLEYRPLRATLPWRLTGFLLGGTLMVAVLMAVIERGLRPRALVLGLAVSLALAGFYDLLFEDLILPPNGDV